MSKKVEEKPLLEFCCNGYNKEMPECDIFTPAENFYEGNWRKDMQLCPDFQEMLAEVGIEKKIPPANITSRFLTRRTTDLNGEYGPGIISCLGNNYKIYLYHLWKLMTIPLSEYFHNEGNFLYINGTDKVVSLTKCCHVVGRPYYRLDSLVVSDTDIRPFNAMVTYREES